MRTIDEFLDEWPDAEFGPAHIVLSDGNVEDHHVDWCLGLLGVVLDGEPWLDPSPHPFSPAMYMEEDSPGTREEWLATREYLRELRSVPVEERERLYDPHGDIWDGDD